MSMSMHHDEELFHQTQLLENEGESDIYIELSKAITERKCRIEQKKEKIKLMINNAIKLREQLKLAEQEGIRLKKDIEEVSDQNALRVQNIKNVQNSCLTLDTTLCELNNKVSSEKAETKLKKDEYVAAIKDAYETWESYKEKYENFPLAKKLREVKTEVKKIEIAIKQADMDIADFKMKKKMKFNIAERKFHLSFIRVAEKYKLMEEKIKEQKELRKKFLEMKNLIADLKSGKATTQQLSEPSKGPAWPTSNMDHHLNHSQPEAVKFTISEIQVTSPPSANESESSRGGRLFDWGNLLASTGISGFLKKSAEQNTKLPMNPSSGQTPTSASINSKIETLKGKSDLNMKKASSLKLTNLLRNASVSQRKPGGMGNKRTNITTDGANTQDEGSPCKKLLVATPQAAKSSVAEPSKLNNAKNKNTPEAVTRDKHVRDNIRKNKEKENADKKISKNSKAVGVKSYMSTFNGYGPNKEALSAKTTSQNLNNILSIKGIVKERKSTEPLEKNLEQPKPIEKAPANNQKISHGDQKKNYDEETFQNADADRHNQKFDNNPIMLEPGSPAPDLIPVEGNSQPLSQGNNSITSSPINFNLSGGSDLISPDVDEATRMVYQRMISQGPYSAQEYARESSINPQDPISEVDALRSKYFSDPQTLNTPPDGPGGDFQPSAGQPFSPPFMGGEFDSSQLMDTIPSPPPANASGCGESVATSNVPTFSFMGSSKKPSKSFFDFF